MGSNSDLIFKKKNTHIYYNLYPQYGLVKVKNDHRSKFSNLSNWKEEAWKNQGFNGIRTVTSAIPGFEHVEALIFSGFFFPIA